MKTILTILLTITALTLLAQDREYTTAEVTTINTGSLASGGDLYHDTEAGILYIGLMTGKLVAIQNTDDQQITQFEFNPATYEVYISLESGGQDTIDLTTLNNSGSDDQIVDLFDINSNQLRISLETDGVAPNTVDLSPYLDNTDDQTVDQFDINSNQLRLSLESDGAAPVTVDLAPYLDNTDDQTVDQFDINANQLRLSLEDDGAAPLTVNLAPYLDNTDDQTVDQFDINSNQLRLSLEDDGAAPLTVNLTPYLDNTDDQTLTYTNTDPNDNVNTLQIEGSSAFNIADNHLGTDNQTLTADRQVDLNGSDLTFNGTTDMIIEAGGDVGIGTATPAAKLDVDNGSVRFSDYGNGTYIDSLATVPDATTLLAVQSDGDVVETNSYRASKVFYPPAVVIDVSTVGNNYTLDLYQEYIDRMGSPTVSSSADPIPVYSREELEYYVLDFDSTVFNIGASDLTSDGVLTYDVIDVPSGNCTFLNVIFVVK